MSFVALALAGCSPSLSQPRAPMEPDVETSTTSLTSGEALPTNRAPLEAWDDKPAPAAAPAVVEPKPAPAVTTAAPAAVPVVQTWEAPAPVVAPTQPAVPALDPWSYP
jgi:hypothetical protein